MTRIPTPLNLESIPPEHAFGGLVRVVSDGNMLEYDETRVERVYISQTWYSEKGKKKLREDFIAMVKSGKIGGTKDATFPSDEEVDPYIRVAMHRIGSEDNSVSWFWDGNGVYDGYESDGSDIDGMDDDVFDFLDDDDEDDDDEDDDDDDSEDVGDEDEENENDVEYFS